MHGGFASSLGGVAGRRLQGMVVVQRDGVENQILDGRRGTAGDRFGTTGTFLEGQPDHRRTPRLFQRLGYHRYHAWRQGHHRRGSRTEFEETAPRDALFT